MDQNTLDQIRFCAFCPNICRIYYPTTGLPQKESLSSSALAYLGHAVISGFIEYTPEVDALLNGMEGAQHCRRPAPIIMIYPFAWILYGKNICTIGRQPNSPRRSEKEVVELFG